MTESTNETEDAPIEDDDLFFKTIDTLIHDLMQITLDELKVAPASWAETSEAMQDEALERISKRCIESANKAGRMIAVRNNDTVSAKIGKITIKDPGNVEAVVRIFKGDSERSLMEMADQSVKIAFLETYDQGHNHESDADQPDLPLDEGEEPDASEEE